MSNKSTVLFFEVFEGLKNIPKGISDIFQEVLVEKVVLSKAKAILKIYIKSNHIISVKKIRTMEYQLHKQLFSCYSVNIYERYDLSEQYTPNKLMDMYKDSLLEELRQNNILGYNILNNSKIDVKIINFALMLRIILFKNICGEFSNYITDVFSNKFGL